MFKAKKVIITGGSSGIGLALARSLARQGADLALVARDRDKLDRVGRELSALALPGARVLVYSCDAADASRVDETAARIAAELGPPQLLINSAGVLLAEYFERQSLADFRSLMDINFFGALHFIQAVLPSFRERGEGRIVNVSSLAGVMGVFGYSSYCASKHALVGLSRTLRAEFKPQGIAVHLVLPPETSTPMLDRVNQDRIPENKALAEIIPALSAERVADDILKGVAAGRFLIIPGARAGFLVRFAGLTPFLERVIMDATIKRVYRGPGPASPKEQG